MTLTIIRLCYALYASGDHVTEPLTEVCITFEHAIEYDVRECPGEVTTPADRWDTATCEE